MARRRADCGVRYGVLFRRKPLDRAALVAAGDQARTRGRISKAIGFYRRALEQGSDDPALHGKLAPLLARKRQKQASLASFAAAAAGQSRAGFTDRAIALQRQAVELYPDEPPLWNELVRLFLLRGRRADAVAALVGGGRTLLRRRDLAVAERLLKRAIDLEPWQPSAVDLLARTLSRAGRKREALELLEAFGSLARGLPLRRARTLAFRISPTPRNLWRWLQAAWRGR
jgi:tetratricopeptide (TPR) repeat protein